MRSLETTLLYGLTALVCAAPLPFGAVQPRVASVLAAACLLLAVAWVFWRRARDAAPVPWREPFLVAGGLLILIGVAQLVPLPRAALTAVSPGAAALRSVYEPGPATPWAGAGGAATAAEPGAATAVQTGWRPLSLYPWATRQATLRLIAYLLAGLIALDLSAVPANRRVLATGLVAGGAFQAIYGLGEFFTGRQHIFAYAKKYYADVATGTFINRNHFAGYLEMTLPFAIALTAMALARLVPDGEAAFGQRLANAPGKALFAAVLLLLLSLTMATALVCSRSRTGIASIVLALVAVGWMLAWRGRGKAFGFAAAAVAGATLILFSQGGAGTPVLDRFAYLSAEWDSGLGRLVIWKQAWNILAVFPAAGAGLGVFPFVVPAFRTAGAGIHLDHAHNDYLEFASETGIVGVLLAAAAIALVALSLRRRRGGATDLLGYAGAASIAALAFHSLPDFNLAIPANALTLAIIAGMTIGVVRGAAPVLAVARPAAPGSRPATTAWRALLPATAFAILAAATTLPVLNRDDADRLFRQAGIASESALEDLKALARGGGVAGSPSATAAGYVKRRLEQAAAVQARGLRHLPVSSGGHLLLGQILLGRCAATSLERPAADPACVAGALPELRAAVDLNPMSAKTHAQTARVLLAAWQVLDPEQQAEARLLVDKAIAMNAQDRDLQEQARLIARAGGTS